jgi:hypothetical protein
VFWSEIKNKNLGGHIMKAFKIIILAFTLFSFFGNAIAQDDFYQPSSKKSKKDIEIINTEESISEDEYSTATDYYIDNRIAEKQAAYDSKMGITDSTTYYQDENGNTQITNNYYNGDNYDLENEYYDYEYSSRIKRFRRNQGTYGYYDDYYTNYYWYDANPNNYGTSIYTSYNWWNPGYSVGNVGWSYYGGWNLGWSWGWGYSGNFGHCGTGFYGNNGFYGSSYWGGHNHHNSGYYASNNYYNSYDNNSHYYGKRGSRSSASGYGKRSSGLKASKNKSYSSKTFGQRYETSVKNSTKTPVRSNTGNVYGNTRANSGKSGYGSPKTTPVRNTKGYSNPRTNPVKSNNGYNSPRTTKPSSGYTRPANNSRSNSTYSKPTYNKPKSTYSNPRSTYNKPKKTYTSPRGSSKPSYSKPSGNYNRSKSTTRSSGSRSGGSKSTKSGGQRRR